LLIFLIKKKFNNILIYLKIYIFENIILLNNLILILNIIIIIYFKKFKLIKLLYN